MLYPICDPVLFRISNYKALIRTRLSCSKLMNAFKSFATSYFQLRIHVVTYLIACQLIICVNLFTRSKQFDIVFYMNLTNDDQKRLWLLVINTPVICCPENILIQSFFHLGFPLTWSPSLPLHETCAFTRNQTLLSIPRMCTEGSATHIYGMAFGMSYLNSWNLFKHIPCIRVAIFFDCFCFDWYIYKRINN